MSGAPAVQDVQSSEYLEAPLHYRIIHEASTDLTHYRKLEVYGLSGTASNAPGCCDTVTFYITLNDDRFVSGCSWQGDACAVASAFATLMCDYVSNMMAECVDEVRDYFLDILAGVQDRNVGAPELVCMGLRDHPRRHACVRVVLDAIVSAMKGSAESGV